MGESGNRALRLLSLDGGGVRGYSELIILEEIMRRVQKLENLESLPHPAEYFDMIGGTSTGGLIAIMLGRLGMSVEECIDAYEDLCFKLFGKKESMFKQLLGQAKYSSEKFTEVLRSVVNNKLGNPDAKLYEPGQSCKIFVCTIATNNILNIRLLKSYEPGSHSDHQWMIWEAARATSAAPTYYPAIEVGLETSKEKFIDAGLGCNNPTMELLREAVDVFAQDCRVACVVSLGTGVRKIAQIAPPTTFTDKMIPLPAVKALQKLAQDSEGVATMLEEKYGELGLYYRFNVEHGLEGVKLDHHHQLGEIKNQTLAYIKKISRQLDAVAASLAGTSPAEHKIGILSTSVKDIARASERPRFPPDRDDFSALTRRWSFAESAQITSRYQKESLSKRFRDARSGYHSCNWFFEREDFRRFRDPLQYLILWVKGMSGCGKSVLASAIVNKLDTKSSNQAIAHTLYYFCQSGSEKTTTRDLLRVLLSQTFERQKNDIGFKLQNSLSGISVCNADTEKSDEEGDNELLQLLVESIRQLDKKVYIVIDGLDYCSADHFTISNFINTILRGTTECRPSVLLTSQSEGQNVFRQLDDGFKSSWVQFEITKHDTAEDLKALIEHRLQSQTPLCDLSSELQQEIVCTILARANGMFLYASLLLDELTSDSIPILSPRAVRFALQQLPKTLTQMYHSQLAIAAKSPYGYGGEICRWVFTSMRPLTWNEIRNALAVYDGHYDEENLIQDTASCDSVIRKWCGSLVETFGEKRLLRFVNPTVREYLGQDSDLSIRIGIPAAHSNVVSKLLVMLQLPDIPDLSQQDPRDVDAVIRKYSETSGRWLYPYAVLNWYRHLKFCGEDGIVNPELRDAVVEFLRSPQSLDWLVTALVMIKSDDGGRISSTAFANDFVDCLSTWLDRWDSAQNIEMKRSVESWTGDFLSLMIDWGAAIERDPFNIYSIHLNLLPEEHTFRDFLVDRSYQSVMELAARTPFTRSCQNAPWFRDVFAVDSERKLAFTFQSNYLRCFLISTGLLVSERRFGSPTARFVRAKLSPNDRYIAMVLEEIPLVDPKTSENISKIREGQQLTILNKLAWCLECDQDEEQTQAIAEMIGIPKACYNVYVVQLNQDGLSSTKMFSTLPGKSKSLVTSYTRSIIWQIDEPHVLEFSSNGPKLATVNGTILLDDGDLLPLKAEEQVSRLGRGTKITEDLQMTVFMKSRNCVGQYDSQVDRTIPKTLSGIGHILAISDRGRFVLLLTVRKTGPLNSTNGNHISGPQKSTISIYDFRTDRMTELLTLMPTKRLAPWKLQDVQFPACFSPENSKRMCVLVCSLKEWNIAPNVHCANGYDDITSIAESPHILIFDGGPKPGSGFGQNPVLRYTADIKDLTIETCLECSSSSKSKEMSPLEAIPCSKQLTWSEDDFQTGIPVSYTHLV